MVIMASHKNSRNNLYCKKKEQNQLKIEEEVEKEEDNITNHIKVIAQEVQMAKSLACNDIIQRNKQMKKLRKWLNMRTKSSFSFRQENFMRIWKGLYYNMWHSDKPLVQEGLAEQLGQLLECFEDNLQYSVNFFGAFLKIMCFEWFGIDQWRLNKFLMLARRMLRYMLKILKSAGWSSDAVELFNEHATETVLSENVSAKGFTMHYFDIYLEELAKVSDGAISAEQVGMFVKPFVKFIATQKDFKLILHCRSRIFYHLLYQSELGREYTEKYNAWRDMGFPTKYIDDLEKVEESVSYVDMEVEDTKTQCNGSKNLDPRAGNIDVFMPVLPLDAQYIIKEINQFVNKKDCATKRRKLLKNLLDLFVTYGKGEFPLGIKSMPRFEGKSEKPLIKEKIQQLDNLENELFGVERKLKQMTKRKRRKFLKSLNFDEVDESNYEQTLEKALPKEYLKGRRKRSQNSFMSSWLEEELSEHDLRPKKKNKKQNTATKENECVQTQQVGKNKSDVQNSAGSTVNVEKLNEDEKSVIETNKDSFVISDKKSKRNDSGLDEYKIVESENNLNKQSKILATTEHQPVITTQIKPKEQKVLKISDCDEVPKKAPKRRVTSEWEKPLKDGEVEYYLPSRKIQVKKANADLVVNPLAKQHITCNQSTPINSNVVSLSANNTPKMAGSMKRVKIALKHNTFQNPIEYIQQIKSSPNIPFDAKKKPGKSLLKPNAMPSPINPFYKKKIGLNLLSETI